MLLAQQDDSDMEATPLDAIDRKILEALQADGRATNVELSARVHLSACLLYTSPSPRD